MLPTRQARAMAADAASLGRLVAGLKAFLLRLRSDPLVLPYGARELAEDAELERCMGIAPESLEEACSALRSARAGDEECENLETLVCVLWCLLHLAEYAIAHDLCLICVRSA